MKTRRIWIVIAVILIAGAGSTIYTRHYVEGREYSAVTRIAAETTIDVTETGTPSRTEEAPAPIPFTAVATPANGKSESRIQKAEEAEQRKEPEINEDKGARLLASEVESEHQEDIQAGSAADEKAASTEAERLSAAAGVPQSASGDETLLSAPVSQDRSAGAASQAMAPLTESAETEDMESAATTQSSVVVAGGGKDKPGVSYKTRLEELDAQIERNRAADVEKSVSNSVKARAENELKLWEAELDGIIKALEGRLDSKSVETLYTEQREWRRNRESKALEVSKKQSGSSLEEVEYTASLTDSTRARAYELVKEYEAILVE